MVDVRCRVATAPYYFDLSTVAILSLIAAVHGGCLILSESKDAEWFQANADFFHWRTTLQDGRIGGQQHQPTQVLASLTMVFSTKAGGAGGDLWMSTPLDGL